jgi:hypothetical protein
MASPPSSRQTLAVTVVRAGSRRFELRDHRGVVLDSVDNRLAARDLVSALKRQCGPGWRIEVTWVGCEAP